VRRGPDADLTCLARKELPAIVAHDADVEVGEHFSAGSGDMSDVTPFE